MKARDIIVGIFIILLTIGCYKEDKDVVQKPVETKEVSNQQYILELEDFTLRAGPDSIFALQNLVLDNILVSDNNNKREIETFNIFKVSNVVLTPDSSGAEIGYQNITLKKYNIRINFKDGSTPKLLNAYSKDVGNNVYTYVPNNNLNVLASFSPHAIKFTRTDPRNVLKMLHPFGVNTIYAWQFRRTKLVNGGYIQIEVVYLAPNNKGNNFNIPLIF